MKTCIKCGESKPTTDFYKNQGTRDGLETTCKSCVKERAAAWYTANPERAKSARAAYYASNPAKAKAQAAKWHTANPDKVKAIKAKWAAANPEKVNAKSTRWKKAHPENVKATIAAWQKANPEARRVNEQNRRARKRESGGKLSKDLATSLFKLQRGKCACGCKQPLGDNYHLDHRMPLALGGSNEDWNMQLLRSTCNLQKHAKHPVDFMQQRGFLI